MSVEQLEARLDALMHQSEEEDCVNLSRLNELVQELDLSDDDASEIQEALEARGIKVSDDCGRDHAEDTRYSNPELAGITTAALQLFLNEIRRYPLLTA